MSFPVPTRYNLTEAKNETVVIYNDGREENLLPWVDGSGGGGGGSGDTVQRKDVNFFDSDGTLLYSYTTEEFASLTEMPQNPSHEGLIEQGWNWSLVDAKTQVAKSGDLTIGQMYNTDDGSTRIYIHLSEERKSPMLGVCPAGTVDVDWGDGTEHDTLTGTSLTSIKWTPTHNYSKGGDYVIKLTVTDRMAIAGVNSTDNYCQLLRYSTGTSTINTYYSSAITKVEIGTNTVIDMHAFHNCYNLTSITIPNSVTTIGVSSFHNCYSLTSITIPNSVTEIYSNAFNSCYSLKNIAIPNSVTVIAIYAFFNCYTNTNSVIPNGVTEVKGYTFYGCYTLTNIVIPNSVTAIGANAFYNCYGNAEYHLLPTIPPTLANTNAFIGIAPDCIIYVPVGSLEAYQTATNWSTYARHMREEAS